MFLKQKVSSELRNVVASAMSDGLTDTGLVAQLGQARFLEGQGIQLNDLAIELEDAAARNLSLIHISEPRDRG